MEQLDTYSSTPKTYHLKRKTLSMRFQTSKFDKFVSSGKVLKNFNIDQEQYKLIKDQEEKKEFVIAQARSHLRDQIKLFDNQIKNKQKWFKKKKEEEKAAAEAQSKTDYYPWLDIKVAHKKNLEWRLKNELIQKLQIPRDIECKYPRESGMKTSLSSADVKLERVLQSKDVLSSGAVLQESISQTFNHFVKTFEKKVQDEPSGYHTVKCSCKSCEEKDGQIQIRNSKSRQQNMSNTLQSLLSDKKRPMTSKNSSIFKVESGNKATKGSIFERKWTDFDEVFYRSYRSEMRERLANNSRTGPWEQVMLGFLRKFETNKDSKESSPSKTQNDDDDPLEIQLINKVNSIPELNNCLDQKYIQKKLNKMNSYELDTIETGLANKIIDEYQSEKHDIKEKRYDYLKQKARDLSQEIKTCQQNKDKEEKQVELQKIHKTIAKRMRIILKGIDHKFINIKSKPATKFDFLFKNKYPYNNPLSKQVKMKIPQSWDSYKTLNLFEYFKEKPNEFNVPTVQRMKYNKENPMEYFASKNTGGPVKFEDQKTDERRKPPMKVVMNAIKIWKSKKTSILKKAKKPLQTTQFRRDPTMKMDDDHEKDDQGEFTYNDLQRAIFNNDFQLILSYAKKIPQEVINKLNLEQNTCLYEAVKFKMHQIVNTLLKIPQIDVNVRCEQSNTALHAAFLIKDLDMISKLLSHGAKADLINLQKKTPFQMADREYLHEIGFDVISLKLK